MTIFYLGRHHDGNHKRWKANFRCALNSLPDVIELKDLGVRKGDNAFKVYKFIDLNDEKDREEKKKMQMVTRSSKKTEGRKGQSKVKESKVIGSDHYNFTPGIF